MYRIYNSPSVDRSFRPLLASRLPTTAVPTQQANAFPAPVTSYFMYLLLTSFFYRAQRLPVAFPVAEECGLEKNKLRMTMSERSLPILRGQDSISHKYYSTGEIG